MTANPKHRRRVKHRKVDRLWAQEKRQCEMTAAPFDRLYRQMDEKWGVDRLIELVSPETAARFGSAYDKMNAAILAQDPEETVKRVGVCMRGLQAMDQEASAAGHIPPPPLLEAVIDGFHFGVMPDEAHRAHYETNRPDVAFLFSMEQIGIAMRDRIENSPAVQEAKKHFPNATVTAVRPLSKRDGREVPVVIVGNNTIGNAK